MTLSDEAKLFAVRKKLLEAERTIYEANKIIANIGEVRDPETWACSTSPVVHNNSYSDTIDGLYPGQLPEYKEVEEESGKCIT